MLPWFWLMTDSGCHWHWIHYQQEAPLILKERSECSLLAPSLMETTKATHLGIIFFFDSQTRYSREFFLPFSAQWRGVWGLENTAGDGSQLLIFTGSSGRFLPLRGVKLLRRPWKNVSPPRVLILLSYQMLAVGCRGEESWSSNKCCKMNWLFFFFHWPCWRP